MSKITAFTIGYAALLGGTFAPSLRAFDKPIAIACLRFLCSPCFKWCISVRTSSCAFGPYFRRELDFFFAPVDRPREDDDREEDVRFARAPLERRELDFF